MALPLLKRVVLISMGLMVALSLSGCGSSEPTERQAFITFLQTRIIDKAGLRVPTLNDAEKKQFGQYAAQYDILFSFHSDLNRIVSGLSKDMAPVMQLRTPGAVMEKRAAYGEVRGKLGEARKAVDGRFEKAKTDYAALQQPAELKPVFEAAFKRMVTDSATLLGKMLQTTEAYVVGSEDLASFLEKNKQAIKFNGSIAEVEDQKLLDEMNAKFKELNGKGEKLQEVVRELQKLGRG